MKPTLPEPEVLDRHLPTNTPITRGYTWKTVQRLIDEAYEAGLEDAAKVCDEEHKRARFNMDVDVAKNREFWNGAAIFADQLGEEIRELKPKGEA